MLQAVFFCNIVCEVCLLTSSYLTQEFFEYLLSKILVYNSYKVYLHLKLHKLKLAITYLFIYSLHATVYAVNHTRTASAAFVDLSAA